MARVEEAARYENRPTEAGHVFVSYARADEAWAQAVIAALKEAGIPAWWDGLIPGGKKFSGQIAEALEQARAVVVLWSANSLQSDWVQDEASVGREHHNLVPLSIDGSLPPLGFRQIQCIQVRAGGPRPSNAGIRKAVAAVADILGHSPPPRGSLPVVADRRTALLAGGAAVLALGGFGAWKLLGSKGTDSNSVAVLPFEYLSGDPSQRYLSDGLSAELRARLARDPAIQVVGQTSSSAVKGSDTRSIAKKLGVANLLTGNVRVDDGQVRIAIELIDGGDGFSTWSNTFDRPLTNLLQLQDEIAGAAARALLPRLSGPGTESRERNGGTKDSAAFDAFLRGKEAFESQVDEASDRKALALFREALAKDDRYAAAHAALSRALAVIANQYAQATERRQLYGEAVAEAEAAISTAPQFAEGHAALGYALFYGKLDIKAADGPFERARQYGSGSADVLNLYALYRARRKQFAAAVPAIERAIMLDPLNPALFKTEGRIHFASGDYRAAIISARRSLALNPEISGAHGDIGNALLMLGNPADALAEFQLEKASLLAIPGEAIASFRTGDSARAGAALKRLIAEEGDNGLYQQAQVLAQMDRTDDALAALQRALAEQDSGLVYLFSDPFLEPLRQTEEFKSLLRRTHFG
ncbi:TIR domain-containing protein [Sphingomonas sp. HDW15A]|uniref:TIR domain-containing protein n=1 Tax=Sphingomonas sp. HDW15A TaxID=2714942 RepID=UPI001407BF7F|nr:TIR domain-containing protein [Sphingomonas sp. HDW15A]QIK95413.1 TIR domain-containing protein [Sphingomonas sp. HDW15A]